jgi:hypothetical protein
MRAVVVLAMLVVLASGRGKGADGVSREQTTTQNLPDIAQQLGVELPASARLVVDAEQL